MDHKKRKLVIIENNKNRNEEAKFGSKRRKIDFLQNQMALDVEDNGDELNSIGSLVKFILMFVYDVPNEIVKIILEYNTWNVWLKNHWSHTEISFHRICNPEKRKVQNVYHGKNTIFLKTTNDQIWCKGYNHHCQLGLGNDDKVDKFVLNEYFIKRGLQIENIWMNQVSFTIFQDEKGKVYGCGYQRNNQFGFGPKTRNIIEVELIEGIENIEEICIGINHSIVLDKNGAVFATKSYGNHQYGQNGAGYDNFSNKTDNFHRLNCFKEKIIAISVGSFHSLFVTNNGAVWSCGWNNCCQLGHGRQKTWSSHLKKINYLIKNNIKIITCASGDAHNLLLDEIGNVYAFGYNEKGQCGLSKDKKMFGEPTIIQMNEKFENIQCGKEHSYMKSLCNTHFLFGNNEYGQCGFLKITESSIYKPLAMNTILKQMLVGELVEIKRIFVVDHFTVMNIVEIQ